MNNWPNYCPVWLGDFKGFLFQGFTSTQPEKGLNFGYITNSTDLARSSRRPQPDAEVGESKAPWLQRRPFILPVPLSIVDCTQLSGAMVICLFPACSILYGASKPNCSIPFVFETKLTLNPHHKKHRKKPQTDFKTPFKKGSESLKRPTGIRE